MKTSIDKKKDLQGIVSVIVNEYQTIGTSYAILLVLVGGIFVYGLMYNYMYEPNLIRNAPVAVVDLSRSELSREYTRLLDAAPQVEVYTDNADFPAAKELMKKDQVIGIVYIPQDFDNRVGRGQEAVFIAYGQTDAFLYYLAIQESTAGAMLALNDRARPEMVVFLPSQDVQALTQAQSMTVVGTPLYNYTEGYGTYLIPAVLMVIIFQTLIMVIAMVSGGERHTGSILRYAQGGLSWGNMARVIAGKTFVYTSLYAIFSLFLLGLMPVVFQLPNIGNAWNIMAMLVPFLLATSFFGLAASVFFTDSDAPLLMIAFFSVGLIFLSGVSYPLELMPVYWQLAHFVIPSAPATLAFVKLNSMGADLSEIRTEYITLWIQCLVYFVLACLAYRHNIRKAMNDARATVA